MGWSTNNGNDWHTDLIDLGQSVECEIVRGQIYAAVKYNNEWKACIIETK